MKKINITTPIYYASGAPHLGHAYTSIVADCFKRYFTVAGYDARLSTGTDEHGNKIEEKAKLAGMDTQAFVDFMAEKFEKMSQDLDISYDDFIRTSQPRHTQVATDIWNRIAKNGDIYLGHYEGLYCVDCEQYYLEGELDDGTLCKIHHTPAKTLREESYFFKLSKYHDILTEKIASDEILILPKSRKNEVLSFLETNPLTDLSISRKSLKWGIPVPNDPSHVMYVWIDALTSYLSTLGGVDSPDMTKYWDNTVHLLGKDILRFHAIYWPCMLMSAKVALPKVMVVHGWWTIKDKKISKSDSTTKIDPCKLAQDLTTDGLKFYLLKSLTLGRDGNIDYSDLISVVNTALANNVGNLVNRFVSMSGRYFKSADSICISVSPTPSALVPQDQDIVDKAMHLVRHYHEEMAQFLPSQAITHVLEFSSHLNTYLETTSPWLLMKDPANLPRVTEIFALLGESIRFIGNLMYPFTPRLAVEIKKAIGDRPQFYTPDTFTIQSIQVTPIEPLFKRITPEQEAQFIDHWTQ